LFFFTSIFPGGLGGRNSRPARASLAQDFLGRLDRTNHHVQAHKDQIDVSHRDRDFAGDYKPAIEYVVECFEQGDISILPFLADDYLIES
jgi:hypothetical protein